MKLGFRYVVSRYNFSISRDGQQAIFNARTGATLVVEGGDAVLLSHALAGSEQLFSICAVPRRMRTALIRGGFIVPRDFDEVRSIRAQFWAARSQGPVVLTLTTTLDCTLGCYYCYESRSADALPLTSVGEVVALAADRLRRSGKPSLHVDWYGGEPMLNAAFLEAASLALQDLCGRLSVAYSASIISNGTLWPPDVGTFLTRHRIRQVQISFDGLREHHDRRRRVREGYPSGSAFDEAVGVVDAALDYARVDLRVNLDRRNQTDLLRFATFARSRGWFSRRYMAVLQPARISAYTEKSSFLRDDQLSLEEFDGLRAKLRASAADLPIEESEAPEGIPLPRQHVCAALAADSEVVGADGRLFRCGLQVSEPRRSTGHLASAPRRRLPLVASDDQFWRDFDPTLRPRCGRCSFLPVCWGGCPKRHLEDDSHALSEQSRYWQANLPRLIANAVGWPQADWAPLTEAQQFRETPLEPAPKQSSVVA